MRSSSLLGPVLTVVLLTLTASEMDALAQPAAILGRVSAPLGLLRLKDDTKPGEAAKLASSKFTVDDLSPVDTTGATKSRKDGVDVLALEVGNEWSRPLRGAARDVSFVSFQLYASNSTLVDVGGARLGIIVSPVDGSVQLMFDESSAGTLEWKNLHYHVGTALYSGKTFAALPTLTFRLEPATNTWDIYAGSRLLADNLPLIAAKKNDRRFVVRAGNEGAWLTGLVFSDENPLYADANANGIDDVFEFQARGALLAADTPVAVRSSVAQQWKEAQRRAAPPALRIRRLKPDSTGITAALGR